MSLQHAIIKEHLMRLEFCCSCRKEPVTLVIKQPSVHTGNYFEDWEYQYININCPLCNKHHMLEV